MSAKVETAMVMAAGLGKRMRPLTATRPKPLVRVAGRPLIDHSFERIADAGIGHVVVNVHYLADALEAHLRGGNWPFAIEISDERAQLLETGGGLVRAQHLFRGDPIACVNSDNIWTDGPVNAITLLANRWDDAAMDALLLVVPQARATGHGGLGDFHMDKVGRLKRRQAGKVAPFVYTGVQLLSKRLLRDAPEGAFSTNILWDRAIAEGRLFGLSHSGQWFDVGTPDAIPVVEAELGGG
jgi:N-acetyl-alpha-D-muramate 1-phosphate uridylyltransferase